MTQLVKPLPQPGETWYSRDGRVAQVISKRTTGRWVLLVEYSDGVTHALTETGSLYRGGIETIHDLVARSPWDAVREEVMSGAPEQSLAEHIWVDAFVSIGAKCHRRNAEVDSEALEFICWAELRGLTPETLVSARGTVAA